MITMIDATRFLCSFDGCIGIPKAKGLCGKHYNESLANKPCSVDGCEKAAWARGWCTVHYHRWRKYGDPGEATLRRNNADRSCKVTDCKNKAVGRDDLCPTHKYRKRLYGTEEGLFTTHKLCIVCGEPAVSGTKRGGGDYRTDEHCAEHYVEYVKGLIVKGDIKSKSGPNGYLNVTIFKKTYLVHRIIMEHKLGRELLPFENVHHKNGRKDDNHPDNLELWVKPQPVGQRVEDLVAWVIDLYPDLVHDRINSIALLKSEV